MGTYNKGILGPFSGKIGTVVGANWRGKDIMRSLPKKGHRTPSAMQLEQREKFLTATDFLRPIHPVLGKYFGNNAGTKSRLNQALSYHLKEAVTFIDPEYGIDFTKVQIAKGDLPGIQNPTVTAAGANQLKFNWEDNSNQGNAKATDQLVVVVYAPATNLYYYLLTAGSRADAVATIALPSFFTGQDVQSWITFASADEKSYATSVYMGMTTVS